MPGYSKNMNATSNVLAWTTHAANAAEDDAGADADEPPDQSSRMLTAAQQQSFDAYNSFRKTTVQRPRECTESLLTRALQSQSEDEIAERAASGPRRRRRSITSNTSLASTAGFTSDTGITTPRTNSPSPRLLGLGFAPVHVHQRDTKDSQQLSAQLAELNIGQDQGRKPDVDAGASSQTPVSRRKPCISFACTFTKPIQQPQTSNSSQDGSAQSQSGDDTQTADITPKPVFARLATPPPPPQETQPKRSCIRFAYPARPVAAANSSKRQPLVSKVATLQNTKETAVGKLSPVPGPKSPASVRKVSRTSSTGGSPRAVPRPSASRQSSHSPLVTRRTKYYKAEPSDLDGESSRFHEFATDVLLEDDWIRRGHEAAAKQRLTIDDTLKKELAIRRLGKEAEEEAEQEEQEEQEEDDGVNEDEDEVDPDGAEGDDDDDDDDNDDDRDDDGVDESETVDGDAGDAKHHQRYFSGYSSGDSASDGYNTDNEVGFASSDDEDDGLILWTVNQSNRSQRKQNIDTDHSTLHQGGSPIFRRLSIDEHSDSSGFIAGRTLWQERPKEKFSSIQRPATPELPDSTDFVCGTFDEDRPLEEAYLSHMEARKRGRLHVIPQDIDPSFPTSDPEEGSEADEVKYKQRTQQQRRQHLESADERFWELDDLHGPQMPVDQGAKKKRAVSPRRYHSPPPKGRGRSPAPRRMVGGQKSKALATAFVAAPIGRPPDASETTRFTSPICIVDRRAFEEHTLQPGLAYSTTSLPRPSAIFRQQHPNQTARMRTQPPLHNTQPKAVRRPKANSTACAKQPRHVRGAIDIVKGLEQKRQRRKEKFQQRYCDRARKGKGHILEKRPQRGEGAERMREVGLFMAGKITQGNYVLSV